MKQVSFLGIFTYGKILLWADFQRTENIIG
jgi:hypothetical protein